MVRSEKSDQSRSCGYEFNRISADPHFCILVAEPIGTKLKDPLPPRDGQTLCGAHRTHHFGCLHEFWGSAEPPGLQDRASTQTWTFGVFASRARKSTSSSPKWAAAPSDCLRRPPAAATNAGTMSAERLLLGGVHFCAGRTPWAGGGGRCESRAEPPPQARSARPRPIPRLPPPPPIRRASRSLETFRERRRDG